MLNEEVYLDLAADRPVCIARPLLASRVINGIQAKKAVHISIALEATAIPRDNWVEIY